MAGVYGPPPPVNALFEGAFGAVAVAAPQLVWANGDGFAIANGRAFGFAALTIALLSVLAFRRMANRELVVTAAVTLVAWQVGITAAELIAAIAKFAPPPVVVIHGVFAVAFAFFLMRARSAPACSSTAEAAARARTKRSTAARRLSSSARL